MTIAEMHVWFRQYAQQMGMQNVRAILPEQIDLLINTSINDIINQLFRENIGITNDRIITDNSKIGQINAFRTLYRVQTIDMSPPAPVTTETRAFEFKSVDRLTGKMSTNIEDKSLTAPTTPLIPEYLYLVDFALNYKKVQDNAGYTGVTASYSDYATPTFGLDSIETNYFPVRLIDDMYLADTLNDFVLRNRLRSPIIVTYNNGTFDLYIDKFKEVSYTAGGTALATPRYVLDYDLVPYQLRMSYVAKPAVVKYAADMGGVNVDCNLPESMHVDILKHAVDLYNTSLQGNLYSQQQQQQAQQREQARNQVRPENEGYKN